MPAPNRLLKRIAQVRPCRDCPPGDWIGGDGGARRCGCLRGRLLRKADDLRKGKAVEFTQEELELR